MVFFYVAGRAVDRPAADDDRQHDPKVRAVFADDRSRADQYITDTECNDDRKRRRYPDERRQRRLEIKYLHLCFFLRQVCVPFHRKVVECLLRRLVAVGDLLHRKQELVLHIGH